MPKIVSIHSFRGGTGKSNITASLASLVARSGKRVGVVDTDIQLPGIHVIFGMNETNVEHTLNDYLWGRLHGAERMIDLVCSTLETPPDESACMEFKRRAFLAIMDEEEEAGRCQSGLLASLRAEIEQKLPCPPKVS